MPLGGQPRPSELQQMTLMIPMHTGCRGCIIYSGISLHLGHLGRRTIRGFRCLASQSTSNQNETPTCIFTRTSMTDLNPVTVSRHRLDSIVQAQFSHASALSSSPSWVTSLGKFPTIFFQVINVNLKPSVLRCPNTAVEGACWWPASCPLVLSSSSSSSYLESKSCGFGAKH